MSALRKCLLIAIGLVAGSVAVAAAQSALITNITGRTSVSLNGTWRAIVDPYETGTGQRFYENAKPKTPRDLVEYDFDTSATLNVPGDWNSQRTELFFYEGPVWYRKSFSYHKRDHSREFVYFGAANYRASVYLNAQKVGEHEGGFTTFNFEVTATEKGLISDQGQRKEAFYVLQRFYRAMKQAASDGPAEASKN
jgi:beta-glucuronidase